MREYRQKTIATFVLIALGLSTCFYLAGEPSVGAAGQSVSSVRGKGLGDAKPIVIEGKPDEEAHITSGWKLFLVGVNRYQNMEKDNDLHYAVKDVESLKARFIQLGVPAGNITILTTDSRGSLIPEKKNIEAAYNRFIASLKEGDSAFVYLSGHGFRFENDKRTYYAPQDVVVTSKKDVVATSVSIDDMKAALQNSAANLKWMTVDACRNDPTKFMDDDPAMSLKSMDKIGLTRNFIVDSEGLPSTFIFMQGCEDGQYSIESLELEQGLMTYALLEGLQYDDNPVDRAKSGELKLVDLLSYVQTRTEELARLCRDSSDRPCVQKPALTNDRLQNVTFLTNLRHDGLTPSQWQLIASEVENFEKYLAASDFRRAQQSLATLASYYPEGTQSEQYQELEQKLVDAKKRQQAEECYQEAQVALSSKEYAAAKLLIDEAIALHAAPEYDEFRGGPLTRGVKAATFQAIVDVAIQKALNLNELLAELDEEAAKANESKIASLQHSESSEKPIVSDPEDEDAPTDPNDQITNDLITLTIAGVKVNFRWIPAGKFQMGSPTSEKSRSSNETQHEVT
ncbi:MAG: caspase family protein, partial [Planctomycetia bacterium]|nr:caspase family protein [Planctomycetia bacterium]